MDNKAPQADNAITHGIYRYLKTGELPDDLTGLDTEYAAELQRLAGGDEKYRMMAQLAARRALVVELGWRNLLQAYTIARGRDVYALPNVIKILNSYMEGLRRDLQEMGLTPQSAIKRPDNEPVTAKDILDAVKGKANESESND